MINELLFSLRSHFILLTLCTDAKVLVCCLRLCCFFALDCLLAHAFARLLVLALWIVVKLEYVYAE